MPKGPKGQKRHADTVKNAVLVMQIATGDATDAAPSARRAGGIKGGAERAKRLTAVQKRDIARLAANARWKKGR